MKSLWHDDARRDLRRRIASLSPDAKAGWGRMSAPEMVAHLTETARMALGELPCATKRLPFRYPPLKQLIVYLAPFPKGAPTAPELLRGTPGEWPADIARLETLLDRLVARDPSRPWPDHPAFGRLSARAWGVLTYKHVDHHLRQFGV